MKSNVKKGVEMFKIEKLPLLNGGYYYHCPPSVTNQKLLGALYEYQKLDEKCFELSGLTLSQMIAGTNKTNVEDDE